MTLFEVFDFYCVNINRKPMKERKISAWRQKKTLILFAASGTNKEEIHKKTNKQTSSARTMTLSSVSLFRPPLTPDENTGRPRPTCRPVCRPCAVPCASLPRRTAAHQTPISGASLWVAKSSSGMSAGRSNLVDRTSTCSRAHESVTERTGASGGGRRGLLI